MIVYVKSGELRVPEADLEQQLNEIRYVAKDISIRTDLEESDSKRVAEAWATVRNLSVQNHGRPRIIIMPGYPECMKLTGDAPKTQIDREAHTVIKDAHHVPGEQLLERIRNIVRRPTTIVWLGETEPEEPTKVQEPC